MSHDLVTIVMAALPTGVVTAVGSYLSIVWKLTSRVDRMEESIRAVEERHSKLVEDYKRERRELLEALSDLSDRMTVSNKEVLGNIGLVHKELMGFKLTCSANRAKTVPKKDFNDFTGEQENKWSEFYRLVGRLEGAMNRMSSPPPKR